MLFRSVRINSEFRMGCELTDRRRARRQSFRAPSSWLIGVADDLGCSRVEDVGGDSKRGCRRRAQFVGRASGKKKGKDDADDGNVVSMTNKPKIMAPQSGSSKVGRAARKGGRYRCSVEVGRRALTLARRKFSLAPEAVARGWRLSRRRWGRAQCGRRQLTRPRRHLGDS